MTPGRFRIEWISAAEGDKYARVINEMQQVLDNIPKETLMAEIDELRPQMERRARRMREAPLVDEALAYAGELEAVLIASAVPVAERA
jgi:hypothetical protein